MPNINIIGVIVVTIILIGLYIIINNRTLDNFIVFLDDVIIPKSCWNYIVTNGHHYFLFNSKLLIDGINNPLKFNSKQEALKHLELSKCPINIPYIDLVTHKKNDDPTVSLQRECNRKVAPNLFDLDICNVYSSDNDTLSGKYLTKIRNIENDKQLYSNYDAENCMINKVVEETPELNDIHFKQEFANYFNRINSNIDEQFLYITSN